MLDGSDAIADWALLNALVNTASGATWVSIHHGGGVGMGRSIHAGQVCVADGTDLAAQKIERVLTNDPGMGVIRHVDAGYDRAVEVAAERDVRIPMTEGRSARACSGGAQPRSPTAGLGNGRVVVRRWADPTVPAVATWGTRSGWRAPYDPDWFPNGSDPGTAVESPCKDSGMAKNVPSPASVLTGVSSRAWEHPADRGRSSRCASSRASTRCSRRCPG